MSPLDFEKKYFGSKRSDACNGTRRSVNVQIKKKKAKGKWEEKVYDYVLACSSLKGKISKMKVIEEFE